MNTLSEKQIRNSIPVGPLCVLLACCLLSTQVTFLMAQSLTVKCLDGQGNPIRGIRVDAEAIGPGDKKNQKSNREGQAVFKKLKDGSYRVYAKGKGFEPVLHEFLILNGGAMQSLEFVFTPGNEKSKLWFEDEQLQTQANQLVAEGIEALRTNNFDEAAKKLTESLSIYPSNLEGVHNLGLTYTRLKKWAQSEELFKKELEILKVYRPLQESPEIIDQRVSEVDKILQQVPMFRLEDEANAAMDEKDYPTAIVKYQEMASMSPDQPAILSNLALAQTHAQELDAAEETVNRGLALRPADEFLKKLKVQIDQRRRMAKLNDFQRRIAEGDEFYKEENYQAAIEKYQAVLPEANGPPKAQLWAKVARSQQKLGNAQAVIEAYGQAAEANPEESGYQKQLAQFHLDREEYDAFIDSYAAALEKDPSTSVAEGLHKVATGLISKGKKEVAGKIFMKVMEIDPAFPETYYELGMHYFYEEKDVPTAEQMLGKYMEIGKDDAHRGNTEAVLAVIEHQKKQSN